MEAGIDELTEAMVLADVLGIFRRLPPADQAKFSDWIDRSPDIESQRRRISAFVLALRIGPLEAKDSDPPQTNYEQG